MIETMKKAARAAADIQLKYFRQSELDIEQKTDHQNIVTVADKKSQDVIQATLLDGMDQMGIHSDAVGFIGEEDLNADGSHVFVIDPIDGTSNFASGIDYFCSSIAYYHEGLLTAGMIYRPTHQEFFYAEKGKGAFHERGMRNEKLEMKNSQSSEHIISFNIGDTLFKDAHTQIVEKLLPSYRGARAFGAVALDFAHVASNHIGISVDIGPYIWDISAGKMIVEEAGGVMFDFEGNEIKIHLSDRHKRYEIISCHPSLKQSIIDTIK